MDSEMENSEEVDNLDSSSVVKERRKSKGTMMSKIQKLELQNKMANYLELRILEMKREIELKKMEIRERERQREIEREDRLRKEEIEREDRLKREEQERLDREKDRELSRLELPIFFSV